MQGVIGIKHVLWQSLHFPYPRVCLKIIKKSAFILHCITLLFSIVQGMGDKIVLGNNLVKCLEAALLHPPTRCTALHCNTPHIRTKTIHSTPKHSSTHCSLLCTALYCTVMDCILVKLVCNHSEIC